MKKASLLFSVFCCIVPSLFSQNGYRFSVDLTNCKNDLLTVELLTPVIHNAEAVYRLPKIVPGTYSVYNYGRLVSDLAAFDSLGNELDIEQLDKNSWKIYTASKLKKISYKVEDSWDEAITKDATPIFEPAGSNFEEGKNFVLNNHCLFGYFDGMKHRPFEITIKHPESFYGACSLTDVTYSKENDVFRTDDYMQLQDAPIMYCIPDTTVLNIGRTKILIAVYSPSKVVTSKFIAGKIQEILVAQQAYLGGTLPVTNYTYLIYITPERGISGKSGALEHSYSSMYFLPEMEADQIAELIKDVSAHEFFHIVTPLNIHAEQIGDFDYASPDMSEHLWLYEGTTEYAAGLVQVKYGKMTAQEYLKNLDTKIRNAKGYNDSLPFTVMSKGCLDEYKNQYGNVYQKGALIGLCLDLKLRYLSKGNYGLQELMSDLSKKYGKEKSFKDEELFAIISALTYPEIEEFFKKYVAGTAPLPLKELLAYVGVEFGFSKEKEKKITLGGAGIGINEINRRLKVIDTSGLDAFGHAMGYKEGDELVKFNGKKITLENASVVITNFYTNAKEGDELKVTVARKQLNSGKVKRVKLQSKLFKVAAPNKPQLIFVSSPTNEQLQLRNAWIGVH